MTKRTALSVLYGLILLAVAVLFVFFVHRGNWLQTDLRALLPEEQRWSAIQIQADQQQEQRLNQQIVALVGHTSPQTAFQLASELSQNLDHSGAFQQVIGAMQPDIANLQQEIQPLAFATLPTDIRQQLLTDPTAYFHQFAQQISNPFTVRILPLEQDWLGFGRFVLGQGQANNKMQWNVDNGFIYTQQNGVTWVLVRAVLAQGNLINPQTNLTALLAQNRVQIDQQQGQLLVTGAQLFAENAKQAAERESTLMSILGVTLTLLLLLCVFRSWRVLFLFVPILVGMLAGVVAVIAYFGQVHILTLVIGTSLIGVLIDFPLHWLSSSLFYASWQPQQAMQRLRFTFLLSLLVTLLGYGLLGFTALPVLKQTALFSGVALIAAMLATLLFLPPLFSRYQQPKTFVKPTALLSLLEKTTCHPLRQKIVIAFALCFVAAGLWQSQWRDDIRQWVSMPEPLLQQAQKIGELTGMDLGSQYFLVVADNDDQLLQREKALTEKLQQLQQQHEITQFRALSQWIMSEQQQLELAKQIQQKVRSENYQILSQMGVPVAEIQQRLQQLTEQQPLSLAKALQTQLGQGWQMLYLGELQPNQVASMVQVSGVKNSAFLQALGDEKTLFWQDKRAHLNQAFQDTRDQAAWLKLLSFALAGLLLVKFFGARRSLMMLVIPLSAIICTIAIFGWLGLPISLFTMFGLLLVSAIGIDYTAYMQTAPEPLYVKRVAVTLAAATTLISFILLGLSSTLAVASFGLSVSLGVAISVLLTFKILR